ncbi:uncharacterized protein [Lolium perenne]|uniref:uncharacterized protein n=1 Tax=Lolium perenne TaxID=4522 RepID=UPI0021F5FD0E|nr:uncharacterized protein LOC127295617 [Lolium perenne]
MRPGRRGGGGRTRAASSLARSKEQHVAEPASAQTLHRLDASLKGLCYTTEMEGSSNTVASLPSPHDTTDAPPLLDRCLSSSPIWKRRVFEWAITFYTIKDVGEYFRIFPDVGRPFQSKDEADKAIDRYLTERKNLTMGIGLSEVDKIIQKCRFFPDGTKKRLKAGQAIDKRRDTTYQLVQAVVYKYNDHHKLFGDSAYEVKDVLGEPPLWEEDNCRMYMHMNFTAKTKGRDDLFFAEVTYVSGDAALAVNCCCIVKSFDNGPCFACGTTMKHPSDGIAYSGARRNGSYCLPFGSGPVRVTWCPDEDSDEEVERLRSLFGGARATARVPLEA